MSPDIRTTVREELARSADRISDLIISQLTSMLGGAARVEPVNDRSVKDEGARRERLSQEAVESALAQVIRLLEKHPNGLRSEQIRAELNMNKKLFQYAAHLGKTSDQLTQTGERRSTAYALPTLRPKVQDDGRVIRRKKKS